MILKAEYKVPRDKVLKQDEENAVLRMVAIQLVKKMPIEDLTELFDLEIIDPKIIDYDIKDGRYNQFNELIRREEVLVRGVFDTEYWSRKYVALLNEAKRNK